MSEQPALTCELDETLKELSAQHVHHLQAAAQDDILHAIRSERGDVIPLPEFGAGFYLVGVHQSNYVLLVKAPGEPLTDEERRRIKEFAGCCEVVRSQPDVLGATEQSYRARLAKRDADGKPAEVVRRRRGRSRA